MNGNGKMDEKIFLDDDYISWREAPIGPSDLLGRNWVYTTINTYAHQPMHVALRLRYALDSYQALFSVRPEVSVEQVENRVRHLLYYGIYPEHGNTLTLYLLPPVGNSTKAEVLIAHKASTPYDGYALLSLQPKAAVTNYEIPFERHLTAVSATAARFADEYAMRNGAGIALRANRQGTLISTGDNPLFALRGNTLLTTPIDKGARPSAERELMMELCQMAGVNLIEEELRVDEVASYEEIMAFTPVGIQTIGAAGERVLHSITAHALEPHLKRLTRQGILR